MSPQGYTGYTVYFLSFIEKAKCAADCKMASSVQPLAYLNRASAASERNERGYFLEETVYQSMHISFVPIRKVTRILFKIFLCVGNSNT